MTPDSFTRATESDLAGDRQKLQNRHFCPITTIFRNIISKQTISDGYTVVYSPTNKTIL